MIMKNNKILKILLPDSSCPDNLCSNWEETGMVWQSTNS